MHVEAGLPILIGEDQRKVHEEGHLVELGQVVSLLLFLGLLDLLLGLLLQGLGSAARANEEVLIDHEDDEHDLDDPDSDAKQQ